MSEQESAQQQRIAELEEQLAEIRRQYDLLVRQIFGRKSEQTPAPRRMRLEARLRLSGGGESEAGRSIREVPAIRVPAQYSPAPRGKLLRKEKVCLQYARQRG